MKNPSLEHESLYRGPEFFKHLENFGVVLCGAGAVGSNLCETLARQGYKHLQVIDFDRVTNQNLGTQCYGMQDVGLHKVVALHNRLFRDLHISISYYTLRLTVDDIRMKYLTIGKHALIVDSFDNSKSRRMIAEFSKEHDLPCLHVGMSGDGYGEVVWNEGYRIPEDGGQDICDYPLARNLVMFVVHMASEAINQYVSSSFRVKTSLRFTLKDMAISL